MKKAVYFLSLALALVACSSEKDEPTDNTDKIFHDICKIDSYGYACGGPTTSTLLWDLSDFPYSTEEICIREHENEVVSEWTELELCIYMPKKGGYFKLDAGRGNKCLNRLVREGNISIPEGYSTFGKYFATANDLLDYMRLTYDVFSYDKMTTLYNAVESVIDPEFQVVYVDDENTRTGKLEVGGHKFINNDDGSFECTIGENKTGVDRVVHIFIIENTCRETESFRNAGRKIYIFQPA